MAFISSEHKKKMHRSERMGIIAVLLIVAIIVVVFLVAGVDKKAPPSEDVVSNASNDQQSNDTVQSVEILSNEKIDSEESTDSSATAVEKPVEFVSIKIDNAQLLTGELVLVNKEHEYKASDWEKDLINVYDEFSTENFYYTDTDLRLRKDVAENLKAMCVEFAQATTLQGLMLSTSYVTREEQQSSYDKADDEKKPYIPVGGFSEHHTGLAFDLMAYGKGFTMGENQYAWFNDNCWKHGFVLRYPDGKENLTYIKDDTDHFRYVGVPHALYMYRYSLVLEEYIEYLKGITYKSPLSLGDGTTAKYQVYACRASTDSQTEIMVPSEGSGWTYTVSGTNDGYFVITITKTEN